MPLLYTKQGHTGILTFSRPKARNCWGPDYAEGLIRHLDSRPSSTRNWHGFHQHRHFASGGARVVGLRDALSRKSKEGRKGRKPPYSEPL